MAVRGVGSVEAEVLAQKKMIILLINNYDSPTEIKMSTIEVIFKSGDKLLMQLRHNLYL